MAPPAPQAHGIALDRSWAPGAAAALLGWGPVRMCEGGEGVGGTQRGGHTAGVRCACAVRRRGSRVATCVCECDAHACSGVHTGCRLCVGGTPRECGRSSTDGTRADPGGTEWRTGGRWQSPGHTERRAGALPAARSCRKATTARAMGRTQAGGRTRTHVHRSGAQKGTHVKVVVHTHQSGVKVPCARVTPRGALTLR